MFKRHNVKCDDTAKLGIQFTNCEVTDRANEKPKSKLCFTNKWLIRIFLRLERARRDTFKLGRLPFHLL